MQVIGKFKRFWGSQDWSIKIDFLYEEKKSKRVQFSNITVEFKNKSETSNSFEVQDLCSCVQLISKFSVGFGIESFDRRIANWLSEYFNENGVDIDVKTILECLKQSETNKVDVKVKKMNIASEFFTDILEYNQDDLLINFDDYYEDSKWEIVENFESYHYPIKSKLNFKFENKEYEIEYSEKSLKNTYNGLIDIKNLLINDKDDVINDIIIEETIFSEFKPYTILASLIAPDKTVLGVFQPFEIKKGSNGLKVVWIINELKINHQIQITYILKQRIPFLLHGSTDQKKYSYVRFIELNSPAKYNFNLLVPALVENNVFSRKYVKTIEALFPVELETQSILYLYPHYILKIIDQGQFQKIIFSELFIDALFFDQVQLDGSLLPVVTLYESFLPHIGSKVIKKIFRLHSFSNPIIIYSLESSAKESIQIEEVYPLGTQIHLLSLGDQHFKVIDVSGSEILSFSLNANAENVKFALSGSNIPNLEKALAKVKIENKEDNLEVTQNINVESIIDKASKIFAEIKKLNIDSDFTSNKMRLRSFNLKITEKISELDSSVNDSELDRAFAALQNEDVLQSLKSKIKTSYESKFNSNEDTISQEETDKDYIAKKPFIEVTSANEQEVEENLPTISNDVEESEMSSSEMDELSSFINDYSEVKEPEESPKSSSDKVSEVDNNIFEITEAKEQTTEEPVQNDTLKDRNEKTEELNESPPLKKKKIKKSKSKKSISAEKPIVDKTHIEITVLFENISEQIDIPGSISSSSTRILAVNKNLEELLITEEDILEKPEKIYFKIPENDRFIILLINPNEDLASHIYGRWKKSNFPKYKMLTNVIPGTWHIKMQLLESGETFDIKFRTS